MELAYLNENVEEMYIGKILKSHIDCLIPWSAVYISVDLGPHLLPLQRG